jgi:protoheme IX farnesyltransferase
MKAVATLPAEALPLSWARAADYVALTKPRIAAMVLVTVAAGALLAGNGAVPWWVLLHAVVGAGLTAAGASALNQWLERDTDALMRRTRGRPLPAGRLQPAEVFAFGVMLSVAGVAYLAVSLPRPGAAVVAAVTCASYVGIYTPLKSRTPLNTLVGAVPGAMPPLIGWCAVRGAIGLEAIHLFLLLFLWQVPHFLAIAWIYRDEYAGAGLCMLPGVDRSGTRTARHMVLYCLTLLAASLAPVLTGEAGVVYLAGAVVLGAGFLGCALAFRRRPSLGDARRVVRASLVYLPAMLALLLLDRAFPWPALPG